MVNELFQKKILGLSIKVQNNEKKNILKKVKKKNEIPDEFSKSIQCNFRLGDSCKS